MAKIFHQDTVYLIQFRLYMIQAGWDKAFVENLNSQQLGAIAEEYGAIRRASRKDDIIKAIQGMLGDVGRG